MTKYHKDARRENDTQNPLPPVQVSRKSPAKVITLTMGGLFGAVSLLAISACTANRIDERAATPSKDIVIVEPNIQSEPTDVSVETRRAETSVETAVDIEAEYLQEVPAPVGKPETPSRLGNLSSIIDRSAKSDGVYSVGIRAANQPNAFSSLGFNDAYADERFGEIEANGVTRVEESPVSTFSIDVDTASYALVRDRVNNGHLPPAGAVRIEEFINYFNYDYDLPDGEAPFSVNIDATRTPWNKDTHLVRIGLKGREIENRERPAANLVFLLDVSGSMQAPDKLPLLQKSLEFMSSQLNVTDKVSIVVYAGASGVVLEPTSGDNTAVIRNAINRLRAGGSTAGAAGIELAYQKAQEAYIDGGINRVILATDGDFNVGVSNVEKLKEVIEAKRESGVSLTTLGFGDGNFNDHLMEQLSNIGNGNYAYVDSYNEARKVLGGELSATLQTIAKDVKIQIEFNPDIVSEYRLIGYENRMLKREDFNNDKVDAGEIGAGHTVTALYEVALKGEGGNRVDDLRYEPEVDESKETKFGDELAFVKLRYKAPDGDISKLVEKPVMKAVLENHSASPDLQYAAAVAGYGQLLRGGDYMENFGYDDVVNLAKGGAKDNIHRQEFLSLVEAAASLSSLKIAGR